MTSVPVGIMELTKNQQITEDLCIFSISQNHFDENDLIDCVQRLFFKYHVGKFLSKCNGMKEQVSHMFPCFAALAATFCRKKYVYIVTDRPF